jgi:hypothetical protein
MPDETKLSSNSGRPKGRDTDPMPAPVASMSSFPTAAVSIAAAVVVISWVRGW